ncbi:MAG: VanW family protein [Anaerosomatales bacterium]|nr:VanW family protein [Anaerosomatales bacterium]MDT8433307.1 VanW family protein [Anaerosomatales bacterium]
MTGRVDNEAAAEVDGRTLLEEGRRARQERAESRTLGARVNSIFADRPAWMRGAAIGAVVVATTAVALVLIEVAVSWGRVHPGVRVGEVRIGAMTATKAAAKLEETFEPRLADPVALTFEDEVWQIDAAGIDARFDGEVLVAEAMEFGRTGSLGDRIAARVGLWFTPVVVPVTVEADRDAVSAFLAEVADVVEREPRDATVVVEGTEARLEAAVLGIAVREDDVRDKLLEAFVSTDRDVECEVDFTPVGVTDTDAQQALEDAQRMLAGPVSITDESKSWEFAPVDIAPWIAFRTVPASSVVATQPASVENERSVLQAYISAEEASAAVLATVGVAGTPAVDARFQVGGGSVTIVPSRDGVGIDVEALATEMTRVLTTEETRTVQLRTRRIEPELTTEKAEKMGIKERIATYTTTYLSTNKPRVSNIHTLTDALEGTLVAPGATFSFNDTIGPRTAAKGYQEAPAIIGGRLVPSLGGGICQVATTIFNTVFESGLPVVERRNHSFYISSYPKGRDATVSWGGVDFKFKNDTDHWIYIATAYTNSSVTISLYGTDPGYTVRGVTGEFTDVRPFPTREIKDDTVATGTRVVEDAGVNGRRIAVKRTVLKGGTVVREDTFTSAYAPKEQVVRIGTKAGASSESTATAAVP